MSTVNTRVIDLEENVDPTGEESLYITTEYSDEKISLNGVKTFLAKTFSQKNHHLSDVNAVQARENLSVYSRAEILAHNAEMEGKITKEREKNTEQDAEIATIKTELWEKSTEILRLKNDVSVSLSNTENTLGEIQKIEKKQTANTTKLAKIEKTLATEESHRIGLQADSQRHETKIAELEESDKTFAKKEHTHTTGEIAGFREELGDFLRKNIVAGDNVFITNEAEAIRISSVGGTSNGTGTGSGDMLASIYDANKDGKIDIAENSEKLGGQLPEAFMKKADYVGAGKILHAALPENVVTDENFGEKNRTIKNITIVPEDSGGVANFTLSSRKNFWIYTNNSGYFWLRNNSDRAEILQVRGRKTYILSGLDVNGQKIENVGAPTSASDAANKEYVDGKVPNWGNLEGKPETFPASTHTHAVTDIEGLENRLSILGKRTWALNIAELNEITNPTGESDAFFVKEAHWEEKRVTLGNLRKWILPWAAKSSIIQWSLTYLQNPSEDIAIPHGWLVSFYIVTLGRINEYETVTLYHSPDKIQWNEIFTGRGTAIGSFILPQWFVRLDFQERGTFNEARYAVQVF